MKTTGDGALARFDGPARAVSCGLAIADAAPQLGLEVRAGLHTGEIELRGDDIGGISAHVGARVVALAGPREVLVSRTVRDLVAGSGLEFFDRARTQGRSRLVASVRRLARIRTECLNRNGRPASIAETLSNANVSAGPRKGSARSARFSRASTSSPAPSCSHRAA